MESDKDFRFIQKEPSKDGSFDICYVYAMFIRFNDTRNKKPSRLKYIARAEKIDELAGAVVLLFIGMLFFMPLSITLDESSININRPLKTKKIPLSEVADVKMCPPTMGAIRVCGSGGWFGWYGWFREKDLGKYFTYYGKASDCFLVTLKDGRKYMLGCKDAPEMSDAIQHKLNCR